MKPLSYRRPQATVVIVSYESADELMPCLESIRAQNLSPDALEVIVVDNASSDESVELVKTSFPEVRVLANSENVGFAAANNQAWQEAAGEHLILVNPDSVLEPDAISAALDHMKAHPECGMCGGLLLDDDGKRAPSARRFPNALRKLLMLSGVSERFSQINVLKGDDYASHDHSQMLEVDWVPGAFTAIRGEMIRQIGLFDERFYLYYEETDLCRRAQKHGWGVHFVPEIVVVHSGGASGRKVTQYTFDEAGSQVRPFRLRSECLYHRKNGGLLAVLSNLGFEWGWHQLRCLLNPGGEEMAAAKRRYSRNLVQEIEEAIKATSFGLNCPPRPW